MSREIDALVAEHIMGLRFKSLPNARMEYNICYLDETGSWVKVPQYSTDLNAAMEMVKHLGLFSYSLRYEVGQFEETGEEYVAELNSGPELAAGQGSDFPSALCHAALKLRGGGGMNSKSIRRDFGKFQMIFSDQPEQYLIVEGNRSIGAEITFEARKRLWDMWDDLGSN